jgi:hypothetical protein
MRSANRNPFLPFAVLLSLLTVGPSLAADVPPPPAIEEIQELDDIWVRGKYLSEVIEAAEDNFFKRYNQLNKDQKYDVYCGVMSLDSSSMIMIRKCVPGFIVNNSYDIWTNTVRLGSTCESYSGDATYFCGTSGSGNLSSPQYVPPSPQLLLMSNGPTYARNVLRVVVSDPLLLELVGGLRDLYHEMELTQQDFVKIRDSAEPGHPGRKRARSYTSPRAL